MSRSVSAPSSVTKTSPCWNGLIVPGSTFRYGSSFCSWTRRPRAFSSRPSDAATIPLPSAETTPPVMKTYFGAARVLTGFQGSSGGGRPGLQLLPGPQQRLQAVEGAPRKRAPHQPRALDGQHRLRVALVDRLQLELRVDTLGATTFQRAPGASPRRSGSTPEIVGHQSDRLNGSARNVHTSSSGAKR